MAAPTPRQRVLAAAQTVGATIEWTTIGRFVDACVDAPLRQIWNSTGCHVISRATHNNDRKWVEELADDIIGEIAMGLVPCPTKDCETCEEDQR